MSLAAIGLDPNALDRKADPCEDFYQFACGGWIAKTEIPADKPMAMRSFVAIDDRNLEFLHTTFEGYAKTPGKDPIHKQIGTYYGACMNEKAIEQAGIRPIARVRALINQVRDVKSLSRTIAQLHAAGFDALFGMGPTQDEANAKNVIIGIDQGGLGLPDRDYYLKDDAQKKAIRGAYENYVTSMLTELGEKPAVAKADAAKIIALETEIARVSKDKVARRDPKGMYNKIDKAGVSNAMPSFDWKTYWRIVGLTKVNDVDVTAPKFLSGIDKLLASTPAATWRAYLTFHVGSDAANMLTKKLVDTKFAFQKAITGQPEIPARWKRCVKATTGALPDLVGQVFVDKRFSGDSKKAAVSYVHAISDAMKTNLQALPWMDPTTKERAEAKREAMAYQIGYPPKWKSYTFKLGRNYGTNALAAQRAETVRQFAKIGKTVDLDDWDFPASLVNAFYSAEKNRMVFPAGILQPPFYSVDSSVPVNLGAMGMVATSSPTGSTIRARSSTVTATSRTGGSRRPRSGSRRAPSA